MKTKFYLLIYISLIVFCLYSMEETGFSTAPMPQFFDSLEEITTLIKQQNSTLVFNHTLENGDTDCFSAAYGEDLILRCSYGYKSGITNNRLFFRTANEMYSAQVDDSWYGKLARLTANKKGKGMLP